MEHAVECKFTNDRVFDMYETGFDQKTKSKKVIAVRGLKNVGTMCIDKSFHLTLVACVSTLDSACRHSSCFQPNV